MQTACTPILIRLGKGRHVYVHVRSPAPHVPRWQKTLQMHGFPVQTWENFKGP